MSMQDLEKAFRLIEEEFTEEEILFHGPKAQEFIDEASKLLNINFPETYLYFLKKVGFGGVNSFLVFGLRANNLSEVSSTGVVWLNLNNRCDLNQPNHLIEIDSVGEGTTYCLDTSQMNAQGECPVVAWPIGGYEMTPELEIVAQDFGKFFLDRVEEQLAWKRQEASPR